MRVCHFQRRRGPSGNFSLERVFEDVRAALPADVACAVRVCPFHRGVLRRVVNVLAAALRRSQVNHIVGDVHYLTLGLPRSRTILTIADCVGLRDSRAFRRLVRKYLWYVLPIARSATVTVLSEATRRELVEFVPAVAAKVVVIPCCVSPAFTPQPHEFDRSRYRILQVGTNPNKNLLRLAEALRGLPCELRIIGRVSETQRRHLDAAAIRYSVAFDLTDQEMVAEYRDCDIVAFVSTYEGFGLPILEAQATGRAVVTSNILSMPEVAGDGACLVDPFDVASIRAGIVRVASDEPYRRQLVSRGFSNVARYSPQAVAALYAALYRSVQDNAAGREACAAVRPTEHADHASM